MLENAEATSKQIAHTTADHVEQALRNIVDKVIDNELPSRHSSPIARKLFVRRYGDSVRVYAAGPIWDYLDSGTGIYNPNHAGRGPGGAIIAVNPAHNIKGQFTGERLKALHFKNAQLAAALGFKGVDVFLKKVKGIRPRWIFDRYFSRMKVISEILRVSA
jgi:hypothetical protein